MHYFYPIVRKKWSFREVKRISADHIADAWQKQVWLCSQTIWLPITFLYRKQHDSSFFFPKPLSLMKEKALFFSLNLFGNVPCPEIHWSINNPIKPIILITYSGLRGQSDEWTSIIQQQMRQICKQVHRSIITYTLWWLLGERCQVEIYFRLAWGSVRRRGRWLGYGDLKPEWDSTQWRGGVECSRQGKLPSLEGAWWAWGDEGKWWSWRGKKGTRELGWGGDCRSIAEREWELMFWRGRWGEAVGCERDFRWEPSGEDAFLAVCTDVWACTCISKSPFGPRLTCSHLHTWVSHCRWHQEGGPCAPNTTLGSVQDPAVTLQSADWCHCLC